jgi:hypothetical protein
LDGVDVGEKMVWVMEKEADPVAVSLEAVKESEVESDKELESDCDSETVPVPVGL